MEAGASKGVLCRLQNIRGREVVRLLYPKLVAMNFDQPEAQLFYRVVTTSGVWVTALFVDRGDNVGPLFADFTKDLTQLLNASHN